jgi:hypothetical protein
MISDLRQLAAEDKIPPVLLVFQGSPRVGEKMLGERWPGVRGIADPELKLYQAFGIRRGNLFELAGPNIYVAGARAALKGNMQGFGRPIGDPNLLPGAFLVQPDGRITWEHRFTHAGDHPDWTELK